MAEYPIATKEMIKFKAELDAENNENNAKREKLLGMYRKKRDEIAKAMIGMGNGLKSLTEQKDEIEERLAYAEKEMAYKDPNIAFQKKFGVNCYSINFSPIRTQAEIDRITPEED